MSSASATSPTREKAANLSQEIQSVRAMNSSLRAYLEHLRAFKANLVAMNNNCVQLNNVNQQWIDTLSSMK